MTETGEGDGAGASGGKGRGVGGLRVWVQEQGRGGLALKGPHESQQDNCDKGMCERLSYLELALRKIQHG